MRCKNAVVDASQLSMHWCRSLAFAEHRVSRVACRIQSSAILHVEVWCYSFTVAQEPRVRAQRYAWPGYVRCGVADVYFILCMILQVYWCTIKIQNNKQFSQQRAATTIITLVTTTPNPTTTYATTLDKKIALQHSRGAPTAKAMRQASSEATKRIA